MDTASLRDAVQGIDEAAEKCHSLHKADVKHLQTFCRKTVEQVDKFLMKVEKLGLLAEATIDAKLLTVSLSKCLTYVEDRSSDRVFRFMFKEALSMTTSETSYCVASGDLEEEAKAAVCEGIIEPVIVPLEVRTQSTEGRGAFAMRTKTIPYRQGETIILCRGPLCTLLPPCRSHIRGNQCCLDNDDGAAQMEDLDVLLCCVSATILWCSCACWVVPGLLVVGAFSRFLEEEPIFLFEYIWSVRTNILGVKHTKVRSTRYET